MERQRGVSGGRNQRPIAIAACGALVLGSLVAVTASAAPPPSLTGSNFEIENDANLRVDGSAPDMDWKSVTETRTEDSPSGSGDNAFGQGSKEDTAVPSVVSGSIPPNKSDLKLFGVYKEGETSSGFLHLYWTRVQDPTGTTNMDFELNKGSEGLSSNGVTPIRVAGDLLITYDLSNGGTKATMGKREWTGSEWGPYQQFADQDAIGTINTSAIAEADSDIGALSARTFGEASVRNTAIFGSGTECTTFGYAYLKSRSSDTFSSALKDFIAPVEINLTNCGSLTVIKQTDPSGSTQSFTFGVSPAAGDPATSSFSLTDADSTPVPGENGVKLISDVQAGSYVITETVPTGWVNSSVSCTGSSSAPTYGSASATISVAASSQVVCTFTNTLKPKLTLVKEVNNDTGGTAAATDWTLKADGTGSNDIEGATGADAVTDAVVDADTFTLSESGGPAGYSPSEWSCVTNGGTAVEGSSITLANGDVATCTITNTSLKNAPLAQTTQKWVVHDSLSLSPFRTGAGDADQATATFTLYQGLTCTAATKVGEEVVTGVTDGTAATADGIQVTATGYYSWVVAYSGDSYNEPVTLDCGEEVTLIRAQDWNRNDLPQQP